LLSTEAPASFFMAGYDTTVGYCTGCNKSLQAYVLARNHGILADVPLCWFTLLYTYM